MHNVIVRNVSEALFVMNQRIRVEGIERNSRVGPMLEMPGPVMTTYMEPRERVLFYADRDANPFFHLFESLWMLAGRNDAAWLARYNKRMAEYSSDGSTLNGAYGFRWRHHFGFDQLETAVQRLKTFENDRRTVIAMHDPITDLNEDNWEKDQPCNTHLYLKVRDNQLNMVVCCRSNDMIWGAYGANAVHFSILQEYVAARVGVAVGRYCQFSDSFHAYVDVLARLDNLAAQYDPYLHIGEGGLHYTPEPLVSDVDAFHRDLASFIESEDPGKNDYETSFFDGTVSVMANAHRCFKEGDMELALSWAKQIHALDWRKACVEWLERRKK